MFLKLSNLGQFILILTLFLVIFSIWLKITGHIVNYYKSEDISSDFNLEVDFTSCFWTMQRDFLISFDSS